MLPRPPKDNQSRSSAASELYKRQEDQIQQDRRDRKDISQATYDWWAKKNQYTYQDKYDDNGNIILENSRSNDED